LSCLDSGEGCDGNRILFHFIANINLSEWQTESDR